MRGGKGMGGCPASPTQACWALGGMTTNLSKDRRPWDPRCLQFPAELQRSKEGFKRTTEKGEHWASLRRASQRGGSLPVERTGHQAVIWEGAEGASVPMRWVFSLLSTPQHHVSRQSLHVLSRGPRGPQLPQNSPLGPGQGPQSWFSPWHI